MTTTAPRIITPHPPSRRTHTATTTTLAAAAAAAVVSVAPPITTAARAPSFFVPPTRHIVVDSLWQRECAAADVLLGRLLVARGGASAEPTDLPPNETKKNKEKSTSSTSRKKKGHHGKKKPAATSTTTSTNRNSSSTLPIVQEILNQSDYYQILGTTQSELAKEAHPERRLKKLYRQRALLTHPDKTNGDRRAFDKVAQAYEILSDPVQRQYYNRFGTTQPEMHSQQQQQPHMSAEDLFRSFFGSSSSFFSTPQQSQSQRRRRYQLSVTLEDLYRGTSVPVQFPDQDEVVTVDIPRGTRSGQCLPVSSAEEDTIELQIHGQPHATFQCRGTHDLLVTIQIRESEAWTGCQRQVRHLNGSVLHLVSAAADDSKDQYPQQIRSGEVQVLRGYGMPKDALGTAFGDLYVQFQVVDQKIHVQRLTPDERREWQRLWRKLEGHKNNDASSSEWPYESEPKRHRLQPAAQSPPPPPRTQSDHDSFPGFMPFGTSSSNGPQRFFWSSSAASNPYFGSGTEGDDDGETQCRQM